MEQWIRWENDGTAAGGTHTFLGRALAAPGGLWVTLTGAGGSHGGVDLGPQAPPVTSLAKVMLDKCACLCCSSVS